MAQCLLNKNSGRPFEILHFPEVLAQKWEGGFRSNKIVISDERINRKPRYIIIRASRRDGAEMSSTGNNILFAYYNFETKSKSDINPAAEYSYVVYYASPDQAGETASALNNMSADFDVVTQTVTVKGETSTSPVFPTQYMLYDVTIII